MMYTCECVVYCVPRAYTPLLHTRVSDVDISFECVVYRVSRVASPLLTTRVYGVDVNFKLCKCVGHPHHYYKVECTLKIFGV